MTFEVDWQRYRRCMLCPRECALDRLAGVLGHCGETAVCRVASLVPHFGEEPSFSGQHGSGTVFFSGCSCGCFFCQNQQISHDHLGRHVEAEELLAAVQSLVARGVHNVNLVTPDHFWPQVQWLCRSLREGGVTLPFIYNCSGYARAAIIEEVAEVVDIFLPDMKYSDPELAETCLGDRRYPQLALEALKVMVSRKGMLRPFDESGTRTARRGVLVRHLVLPGQVANSIGVLAMLHAEFGDMLPLSVMSQYRPTPACRGRAPFDREVSAAEYAQVLACVEELGFEQVYIQPAHGDAAFMPDFSDQEEPFAGNSAGRPQA